jgi:hypothetical protein
MKDSIPQNKKNRKTGEREGERELEGCTVKYIRREKRRKN